VTGNRTVGPNFPYTRFLPNSTGQWPCRSTGPPNGSACDTRTNSVWSATPVPERDYRRRLGTAASVPPVPPHATFEQAKALGSAVLHGDDDAWDVLRKELKQKAQQYLPGVAGRKGS